MAPFVHGLYFTLLLFFTDHSSCQTPPGFSPSTDHNLFVQFDDTIVTPGRAIPLDVPTLSPSIALSRRSSGNSHLVLMIDLDAPFANTNRSYSPLLHWLQQSIPGKLCTIPGNYTNPTAAAIAPYIRPQPPPGSDSHRYVILAFAQPQTTFSMPAGFISFYDPENVATRFNFNVAKFVKEAGLTLLAANWFTSQKVTEA